MNDSRTTSRILLKEAATRTVEGAFQRFLDKEINIARGIRSRASTSHNHLREFLMDETARDDAFPRILSIEDSDFLGGSFARHTKIWPLDDIDIYVPIDGLGLVYMVDGWQQPYTVVTDGVMDANPLLTGGDRWMNDNCLSSRKLINGLARVLRRHYPDTTLVRRVGEAVNVRLTVGEGENNDGLGFDVVPCLRLNPHNAWERSFYMIPDGDDGWINTNPRLDQEVSDRVHCNNEGTFRPGVKLFKWWNEHNLNGAVASYFAELAALRAFEKHNQAGQFIQSVSAATVQTFRAVRDAARLGDQQPLLSGAPAVGCGELDADDLDDLDAAVAYADLAWTYERGGRTADAIDAWGNLFGDDFPSN